MTRYEHDDRQSFLRHLEELIARGTDPSRITTLTPFHVHEVDHLLHVKPSPLKYFTLAGAAAGLLGGLGFIIYTVLDWPLITGGKPLLSYPAFVVVAFELTILIGAVTTFAGYLWLSRFPSPAGIVEPGNHGNAFIIVVGEEEGE